MTSRVLQILGLLCAGALLAACDDGRKNPPDTAVRVVNAAPSFSAVEFRREESESDTLSYLGVSDFTYDADTYDFHVDVTDSGALVRVASFSQLLSSEANYAVVLTELGGAVEPVVLEYPPLEAGSAGAQTLAMHGAEGLPPMSVYVEPSGADLAAATPRGTISFGQALTAQPIAAGDYEITLTESGNPANVLLASTAFTIPAASTTLFVIADGADIGPAPIAVVVAGISSSSLLIDRNTPSTLRAINGATDMGARDFVLNQEFTAPLFAAVPFAAETAYAPVPPGSNTLNVTPPGNSGVLELDQTLTLSLNTRYTALVTGDAGALTHLLISDDTRRIAAVGKFRFLNVATQFPGIDFFIVPPGTDIATALPATSIGAPGAGVVFPIAPGTYDLVLRQNGATNILAGPQSFTVAGGGLYGVLAVNGTDTASAGVVLIDDF